MKLIVFGLIFISPPFLKTWLLRRFYGARVGRHAHISWFSAVVGRQIELGDYSIIRPLILIHLKGSFKLGAYSEISSFSLIYGSSDLIVGDESYIGPQSLLNVDEPVQIGNNSALGPRTMIFTHGSYFPYTDGYWVKMSEVSIGDKVWCAAGVFIHPGVEIGDNTFINSRSVVSGTIPPGSVVEGNPASVVYPMERVKRKMSPRRVDAALAQILSGFAEIGLRRELGLTEIEKSQNGLRFPYEGQVYGVTIIPSTETSSQATESGEDERQIFIVNCPGWSTSGSGAMVFDMASRLTSFSDDPIHIALRSFMQRYYGVRFRFEAPS